MDNLLRFIWIMLIATVFSLSCSGIFAIYSAFSFKESVKNYCLEKVIMWALFTVCFGLIGIISLFFYLFFR